LERDIINVNAKHFKNHRKEKKKHACKIINGMIVDGVDFMNILQLENFKRRNDMEKLYFVELDGKDEYCNEAYVVANNCLEAEKKHIKFASDWDEGRENPRKAINIKYLAEERFGIGVKVPVFIK
jgi:hypothetical protein